MFNNFFKPKRHVTPTILQMEALECGPISLSIILAYYGKYITPEEARESCDAARDGSSAINVLRAARKYGLEAEGANTGISELTYDECPCILYWEFNHFIVLEGIVGNNVYINDPATGPRVITLQELDKKYTGVSLHFKPDKNFVADGTPEPSIYKQLASYIFHSKIAFNYIIFVTLLLVFPSIAVPIFSKIFIDNILISGQTDWFGYLVLAMVITNLLVLFLHYLQKKYLLRYRMKIQIEGSLKFMWQLLNMPYRFFLQRSNGDLVERLSINEKIATIISSDITINVVGVLSLFLYLLFLMLLCWQLTFVVLFFALVSLSFLIFIERKVTDMGRRFSQERGALAAIEANGIQIVETLKASSLEREFFMRWAAHHAKTINSQQRIEIYSAVLVISPMVLTMLANVFVLSIGSIMVMKGLITVGTVVAFQALLVVFYRPLHQLIDAGTNLHELKGDMVRLHDVLDYKLDDPVIAETKNESSSDDAITIRNITYGYSRLSMPTFTELSLTIKKGERVAFVGNSGCGKSTLIKNIVGLLKPKSGEIYFNGKLNRHYSAEEFSKIISYVEQENFLFDGSLRDNLVLWEQNVDEEKLILALKDVNIYDTILSRGGLDAKLLERGKNFSNGERQRIEIARALVKDPEIIILDEATSAIDSSEEELILKNIKNRKCTTLIVAHRISTIVDCDKIFVFKNGEIVQQGTHEQLMAQDGVYRQLAQSGE